MRILFFGLSLVFFYNAHAQVKKLNAETAIQNVTIFSSGARIERTALVNIQSGRSEISFTGLSNQLDQQTVRVKGRREYPPAVRANHERFCDGA